MTAYFEKQNYLLALSTLNRDEEDEGFFRLVLTYMNVSEKMIELQSLVTLERFPCGGTIDRP